MKTAQRESPDRQLSSGDRNFFKQVYEVVRTIPRGKVLTYGQIATMLGSPYMARQVGWAMHGCPKGLPWQRVVGAGGKILVNSLSVGEGALLQRRLLEMEGVRFTGQRIDMAAHQFIPPQLRRTRDKRASSWRSSARLNTERFDKKAERNQKRNPGLSDKTKDHSPGRATEECLKS
jgi:methylated-DNA-protein-cysteine methyltransferase-like protein